MRHYERWQRHRTKVPELLSKCYSASMRCAVVSLVIALAFAPQAFAVLRPLFPVKPEPPSSGEASVILGDLVERQRSSLTECGKRGRKTKPNNRQRAALKTGISNKA